MNRIALALCLALALPGAAFAGGLYRWVTKDGRVEVGPFPPPGVHAEPWQPEDDEKPAPATPTRAPEPVTPSALPSNVRTPGRTLGARPHGDPRSPLERE